MKDIAVIDPTKKIVAVNITNLSKYLDTLVTLYNQAIQKADIYLKELHLNSILNGKPIDAKGMIAEISRLNIHEFKVLYLNEEPIGFICYTAVKDTKVLDIVWFFVQYQYRNMGFGTELFKDIIEIGVKNNVQYVRCNMISNDWATRAVFSKLNGVISNITMTVKV